MSKQDLVPATTADFMYWISERHSIYLKRCAKRPWPWTDDVILQDWKFTNAFRQLDKGTVWLRRLLKDQIDPALIMFNTIWYRFFNRWEHVNDIGFCYHWEEFESRINKKRGTAKMFTGAYMTSGVEGEDKVDTYLRACKQAWELRYDYAEACNYLSMERLFEALQNNYLMGKFCSYEVVCDIRFTLLKQATDKLSWCNIGPGAKRGLQRLGKEVNLQSIIGLYGLCLIRIPEVIKTSPWPFELREVEHCLCEFDKYQRVKSGVGRPRSRYKWTG